MSCELSGDGEHNSCSIVFHAASCVDGSGEGVVNHETWWSHRMSTA